MLSAQVFITSGVGWGGLGMSEPLPRKCIWCSPLLTCFSCQAGIPPAITTPVNLNKLCVWCANGTDNKENFSLGPRQVCHRGDGDTYPS